MKPVTVVTPFSPEPAFEQSLNTFANSDAVEEIIVLSREPVRLHRAKYRILAAGPIASQETIGRIMAEAGTEYLCLLPKAFYITATGEVIESILATARRTSAGLVYSDFYEKRGHEKILHPVNDYQQGSVRDHFDFGPMMFLSLGAARNAIKKYGVRSDLRYAGLYDLRLKLSIDYSFHHIPEPLYTIAEERAASPSESLFAYVDPRNSDAQKEMETVFTDYLKKIRAFLSQDHLKKVKRSSQAFPVEASVVISVRNRKQTIAEAARSALAQETTFPFNVIVVDNHSTDGTTTVLADLAPAYPPLVHVIPERTDLGIGGCWNEAIYSAACGRYAVQLDSDDLYSSPHALQMIVDLLRQQDYAMVIGAYTIVNERLEERPPGIIDHREWTDENGHNNALRINGLGAPRAFDTVVMRKIGFLNVSYGEDYAAGLRICREYLIGRIYESLYLCRRWSGNTDAGITIDAANRNDAFKDSVRTTEIRARQEMNYPAASQGVSKDT